MIGINLRQLVRKLNRTTHTALENAARLCQSHTHYDLEPEHLLVELLHTPGSDCSYVFANFRLDLPRLEADLNGALDRLKVGNQRTPVFGTSLVDALTDGWLCGSLEYDAARIRSGFVLIALLANPALAKLMAEVSPEFQKIPVAALRRDLVELVRESVEEREQAATADSGGYAFFSYSHKDSGMVAQFARYLAQEELPRWIDDHIEYGDSWEKVIGDRIKGSKLLMVLMSENSRNSSFVKREIEIALAERKRIIPILVNGEPFDEIKDLQHVRLMETIHPKTPFVERLRQLLVPDQIPSASLQRRRLEHFSLALFEPMFSEQPVERGQRAAFEPLNPEARVVWTSGGYFGFGTDRDFHISLDQSLESLDELDWAAVFVDIRERLPDLKLDTRFRTDFSARYPTIRALVDDLQRSLTWADIRKL